MLRFRSSSCHADGPDFPDSLSLSLSIYLSLHSSLLFIASGRFSRLLTQSAGAVEYTDYFSAEWKDPYTECPGYDTNQYDGEVPVMLELWGMQSTPSLPSLPGPLWSGVVAPDKGPINGSNRTKPWFLHFTVFAFKLRIHAKLNCLR